MQDSIEYRNANILKIVEEIYSLKEYLPSIQDEISRFKRIIHNEVIANKYENQSSSYEDHGEDLFFPKIGSSAPDWTILSWQQSSIREVSLNFIYNDIDELCKKLTEYILFQS